MKVIKKLKPLYANLKRLEIGKYLYTREFELYALENNLDEEWTKAKNYITSQKRSFSSFGEHNTEEEEEAFIYLLGAIYENILLSLSSFHRFLLPILLNHIKWNQTRLDYSTIIPNLKELEIDKAIILEFAKNIKKESSEKPWKIEQPKPLQQVLNKSLDKTKVFIVHGHDDLAKIEVARFIEKLNLTPIILHEQSSSGDTIIEKIERYSNVGFGIVLYTPCDLGGKNNGSDLEPRARQNVVFEHGFLIGKIGRKNVSALVKSRIEKPNDISGVVNTDMDSNNGWQLEIIKDMNKSGYEIDMNLLQELK